MASIAEAMSNFGGRKGHTISGHMDGAEQDKPEHEDGGVHEHLKALHEKMGGKHMHVHQHEAGFTTHHVGEDGKTQGPHEHEHMEALKGHMNKFFNEEEHESPHEEHDGLM